MKVITAPNKIDLKQKPVIFLAGSIEMGKAEDWQSRIADCLKQYQGVLLNPRREHWDSYWKQTISNKKFKQQVEWEFSGLEKSDCIIMYFSPETKSPISLLELGLFSRSHKIICCCPKKFWRRGNVEFICKKFKIPLLDNLEGLTKILKKQKLIRTE
jgi:hypothetical protein